MRIILLISVTVFIVAFSYDFSAHAQVIPANVIPQPGTVRQQDLDSAKRFFNR
jgi:hypothetical protein